MCGRFVSASPPDEIARYFDVSEVVDEAPEPNFNVAPTADVPVVLESAGVRRIDALHWGLVPLWAKDPSIGNRMINARSEGLATRNGFKHTYRRRRCIVPADGFYEWKAIPGQRVKQPYFIRRADGEPLALAGLWEDWRGPDRDDSQHMRSFTILTTSANETISPVHDRMPVILSPQSWDQWLDSAEADIGTLSELLVPAPLSLLTMHAVSTEVNNARNTGSHLIDEVEPLEPRASMGSRASGSGDVAVQGTLL